MTVFGLMNAYSPTATVIPAVPASGHPEAKGMFQFLFNGGLTNLASATFSIIAFYIASPRTGRFAFVRWKRPF